MFQQHSVRVALLATLLAGVVAVGAETISTRSAPSSVYLAAVAATAQLTANAGDAFESFTAPNGQKVQVLVKAPDGLIATEVCTPPRCYAMRPIHPTELPDAYFPAAVAAAQAAHATRLVVPRDTYNFKGPTVGTDVSDDKTCNEAHYYACHPHWTIGAYPSAPMRAPSVADLDIDLSGSLLNFAAPTSGIWILNAARIRLENVSIDWPTLHIASLGTIVSDPKNPGHHALVLDAAYSALDRLGSGPVQIQAVDPWDDSIDPASAPGRLDMSATNDHETYFIFGAPQPTYLGKSSVGSQTFSCVSCKFVNAPSEHGCSMFKGCANFDLFRLGERVIVRHYTYNGFALSVNWSNDVDLERIQLLTGPGMGIAVQNAGGFRGFRLTDSRIVRGAGRLISTASDAINISAFGGDIIVQNNEIAYQGDDGINVSAAPQEITASRPGSVTVAPSCTPNPHDRPAPGDILAFFNSSEDLLGTATAVGIEGTPCGARSAVSIRLSCAGANCPRMIDTLVPGESVLDLTQQAAARFIISHNRFHDNRGHGAILSAPYGKVTGNTFFRNSMGAVDLEAGAVGKSSVLMLDNTLH